MFCTPVYHPTPAAAVAAAAQGLCPQLDRACTPGAVATPLGWVATRTHASTGQAYHLVQAPRAADRQWYEPGQPPYAGLRQHTVVHTVVAPWGGVYTFATYDDACEFTDPDNWPVCWGGTNEHGGCRMGDWQHMWPTAPDHPDRA